MEFFLSCPDKNLAMYWVAREISINYVCDAICITKTDGQMNEVTDRCSVYVQYINHYACVSQNPPKYA